MTEFATAAKPTSPDTFAPATEFATCAKSTSPVTCCPSIAVKFAPSPETYVNTPPVALTFPAEDVPVTASDDKVPTEVMFG